MADRRSISIVAATLVASAAGAAGIAWAATGAPKVTPSSPVAATTSSIVVPARQIQRLQQLKGELDDVHNRLPGYLQAINALQVPTGGTPGYVAPAPGQVVYQPTAPSGTTSAPAPQPVVVAPAPAAPPPVQTTTGASGV